MTLPWGVKDFIETEVAESYTEFVESIKETTIELSDGNLAEILKADVKERKGNYLLILRYQLKEWQL